jgi:glycosyltransferase involved in cell wall biosynthesis
MVRLPVVSRISGAIGSTAEVIRAFRNKKIDVVLLYGLPTVGLQVLLAARALQIPVVFRAIDVSYALVPSPLLVPITKALERIVFRYVAFNVALTPHLKKYILSYGVPDSRIRLLPSGVDAEMFSPGPRNSELLQKWGIAQDDLVVLFMGTLYRFSGLDAVIQGFSRIISERKNAKLLIVGSGEDESRLKELAYRLGLQANVVFTGMQPYSILPDVIRSSDICINPFELNEITHNILPTKLFQYMTCAKPVLATPLPGTQTFLAGEEQGVVYADLNEFNNRLLGLLLDDNVRETLGKRGREAALKYEWRRIAETMSAWLEEARRVG